MFTRARSTALYARMARYPTLHQFIRYSIVGALNLTLGLAIFNGLRLAAVPPVPSQAAAFFVTSLQGFALHKTWSFRDQGKHPLLRGYVIFVTFTLIGMAINLMAFRLFLIPFGQWGRIGENMAVLAAVPFSVGWNFLSYRRWTFTPPVPPAPAASERSLGPSSRSPSA